MVNHYGFAALKDKRAEITGRMRELEKELGALQEDLAHLDATIRLFDPTFPLDKVRPRRARRLFLFKEGQLTRLVLDTLRKADGKPQSTAAVAAEIAKAIGREDAATIINRRTRASLAYLERVRKLVVKEGSRRDACWRIA